MKSLRRFPKYPTVGSPNVLAPDHPAARMATTRYPATVRDPEIGLRLLKSGSNNKKIGSHCTKGKWAGMPIFMLTLEERATCPTTCKHWLDCYGNSMNWAHRFRHGDKLEQFLDEELRRLAVWYPAGFIVRLHVLGDFYSVAYVEKWRAWLKEIPALNVYGYSAWEPETPIGFAIHGLAAEQWERFAIRRSDGNGPRTTRTFYGLGRGEIGLDLAIVCPAQTHDTECCGTCALCWQSERPIVFLSH